MESKIRTSTKRQIVLLLVATFCIVSIASMFYEIRNQNVFDAFFSFTKAVTFMYLGYSIHERQEKQTEELKEEP